MAIKLHRCRQWVKLARIPAGSVEKALIDQGIAYEDRAVRTREARRGRHRPAAYPAIQLQDGTWYREESKEMDPADPRGTARMSDVLGL